MLKKINLVFIFLLGLTQSYAAEIKSIKVNSDLSKSFQDEAIWKNVKEEVVSLVAQPMALPRPKTTSTESIRVKSVHDEKYIAFHIKWSAKEKAEAGKLGEFSDAVAIQFPVKEGTPPPIFMGAKDNPVHIFHWRAQYQRDVEKGKPKMTDLYPNMNIDMYPMEYKDSGNLKGLTAEKKEQYSPGKAIGNPQSYEKPSAVDEIFAEGFGSSSVIENHQAQGYGVWKNGEWNVVIVRPLKYEGGSSLEQGKSAYMAFAVWQGAKKEVGARKSVTMSWVPLVIEK